jgi:uncharacterized protein YeaC (DUF1315 family)
MQYDELVDSLTPEVLERLRQAVATGRWPDGRPVTPQQREHSLQAVIAWESKHLAPQERVGFIDKGRKAAAPGAQGQGEDEAVPLRVRNAPGRDA